MKTFVFILTLVALAALEVVHCDSGSSKLTNESPGKVNKCVADHGVRYHYLTDMPVITLVMNGTVTCETCSEPNRTQIECSGDVCDVDIVKASCIIQGISNYHYYSCVFINENEQTIDVATYGVEYEQASDKDDLCVLTGSERVWYNSDFESQRRYLIILLSCVLVGSLAFITLITVCCCVCCRRRRRPVELPYSYEPPVVFY